MKISGDDLKKFGMFALDNSLFPVAHVSELLNKSGVYVIGGSNRNELVEGSWEAIDVGESKDVHSRINNGHPRKECWRKQGFEIIAVFVYYTDEDSRMEIEQKFRKKYNPPCGER